MELQCNALGAWSKFLNLGHDNTRLIVLGYFEEEFWSLNMHREDLVEFFEHSYQWDNLAE